MFTVTLHSGVSGAPLLEAVEHKGVGRDVAYVTEDPREFFLVIESSTWTGRSPWPRRWRPRGPAAYKPLKDARIGRIVSLSSDQGMDLQ